MGHVELQSLPGTGPSPLPLCEGMLVKIADVIEDTFSLTFESGMVIRGCLSPSPHHPMSECWCSAN